jgi:CDP-diacylglycerol--serine O-phosphatidyltransferase
MAQKILTKPKLGGAIYVLPNGITTGNLFFGFFSIIKSLQGDFVYAASAILLAAVFDMLDGRVARLTKSTSEFGVQYDSLCDIVSFGVAPAFLMYQGGLNSLGRFGWVVCFVFMACGALRLARFNVQSSIGQASGDFTGLPIPMAAGTIACYQVFASELGSEVSIYPWVNEVIRVVTLPSFHVTLLSVMGIALAFFMVSNIPFRSHKALKFKHVKPFKLLVIFVVLIGLVAYQPEVLGFLFFLLYALSGPVEWLLGWKRAVPDEEIFFETDQEEET